MAETKTEFDNGIKVDGDSVFTNSVSIGQSMTVAGDLAVSGNLTFSSTSFGDIIPSGAAYSLGNTSFRWHVVANTANFSGNVTFGSLALLAAATSSYPSLRMQMGVAPGTPANGDFWANSTGIYTHIAGTTQRLAFISSNISGSAATANSWSTGRAITLSGDLSGNVIIDGTSNATLSATIAPTLTGKTFSGAISVQGDVSGYTATISNGVVSISRSASSNANTNLNLFSGAAVDARRWTFTSANDGLLYLRAPNDADSSSTTSFSVARTGVLTFVSAPRVGSDVIWHAGNDGTGSGLDADRLQGQVASYYSNASNLSTGTVPAARLSGTYAIDISSTANNATNLAGQAASYYTNIPARLGYTPVNKAGDTLSGNLNFSLVSANLGTFATYSDTGTTGWYGVPASNSYALYDLTNNNAVISYSRTNNVLSLANTIATFNMVRETRTVLTISSGAITANVAGSNFFEITLSNNITTVNYNNLPAAGIIQMWIFKVNVGGAYTITWPSSVTWAGGLTPTLPTGSGNSATIVQYTTDGGAKIHSFYSGPTS